MRGNGGKGLSLLRVNISLYLPGKEPMRIDHNNQN